MKRRGGKHEGTGQKKSLGLTNIMREINQKHWRANHHYIYIYIYLENRFELRVMAACFRAQTKTSFSTRSIISLTRTTSNGTLFSTGRASALAMIWVWFLNLDSGEVVETKLKKQNIWLKAKMNDQMILRLQRYSLVFVFPGQVHQ